MSVAEDEVGAGAAKFIPMLKNLNPLSFGWSASALPLNRLELFNSCTFFFVATKYMVYAITA